MEKKPETVALTGKRVLANPRAAPLAVHKFSYSRVGSHLNLEAGHFDVPTLKAALEGATEEDGRPEGVEVPLVVDVQLALTPEVALDLFRIAKYIVRDLVAYGQLPEGSEDATYEDLVVL